jgi:hypothetical protein
VSVGDHLSFRTLLELIGIGSLGSLFLLGLIGIGRIAIHNGRITPEAESSSVLLGLYSEGACR